MKPNPLAIYHTKHDICRCQKFPVYYAWKHRQVSCHGSAQITIHHFNYCSFIYIVSTVLYICNIFMPTDACVHTQIHSWVNIMCLHDTTPRNAVLPCNANHLKLCVTTLNPSLSRHWLAWGFVTFTLGVGRGPGLKLKILIFKIIFKNYPLGASTALLVIFLCFCCRERRCILSVDFHGGRLMTWGSNIVSFAIVLTLLGIFTVTCAFVHVWTMRAHSAYFLEDLSFLSSMKTCDYTYHSGYDRRKTKTRPERYSNFSACNQSLAKIFGYKWQ